MTRFLFTHEAILLPVAILLLGICVVIFTILFIRHHHTIKQSDALIDTLLRGALPLLANQNMKLDFSSGYLMKDEWDSLILAGRKIEELFYTIPKKRRSIHPRANEIDLFLSRQQSLNMRESRNEAYKQREYDMCASLFDSIDGKCLDYQQREAIVTDERNNLIVAGAGSGKTLTIIGKVEYLVKRWNVDPENILVVSYTRKAVGELSDRLARTGITGVDCLTFHAMGRSMISCKGVANIKDLDNCIDDYLQHVLPQNPNQVSAYLEFCGYYANLPIEYESGSATEATAETDAYDLETIKSKIAEVAQEKALVHDTLKGERVKSLEELKIANYLFLHGINYEYEKNYSGHYETNGRCYQPDFYLVDYDIWLEHFGINENGEVPMLETREEERKYLDSVIWKRSVHHQNGTRLIESYSFWNRDKGFIDRFESLLHANGISGQINNDDLIMIYDKLIKKDRNKANIVKLVASFLSLMKANNLCLNDLREKALNLYGDSGFMWRRFSLFITFAYPILDYYKSSLQANGKIDFDDMISMATKKIQIEGLKKNYRYIIVDEYQDISKSRFDLVQMIRSQTGAKLICVGDDWQSIFRFAGSDISLFTDFGKYVGFHETLRIETTYRNSQELVDLASTFIQRNPLQIKKALHSTKRCQYPVIVCSASSLREAFEMSLDSILTSEDDYQGKILVLGRHSAELKRMYSNCRKTSRVSFRENARSKEIPLVYRGYRNITFTTVHKSKGLEADDVIVLNLVNDTYGFPNRMTNDPILELLLDNGDPFRLNEERRLFYVALTRTKNHVYLTTEDKHDTRISPFIKEIWNNPAVATFKAAKTDTRTHQDNYEYAIQGIAEYSSINSKCPICGAKMVKRHSRYGFFLGCSRYPNCCGKKAL